MADEATGNGVGGPSSVEQAEAIVSRVMIVRTMSGVERVDRLSRNCCEEKLFG